MKSAEAFVKKGAWVSHLVLAETTWVLSAAYALDHKTIATAVEMLLNHRTMTIQDADVVAVALDTYRGKPTLDFSDCLVVEIARKHGHVPLGTFDRGLSKVDGAQLL